MHSPSLEKEKGSAQYPRISIFRCETAFLITKAPRQVVKNLPRGFFRYSFPLLVSLGRGAENPFLFLKKEGSPLFPVPQYAMVVASVSLTCVVSILLYCTTMGVLETTIAA